ncbi:MAG TPA: YtxH domain-containing protein [Candidatus Solibacter sp.]|nr:YtxH domain-containing protein [Candidatus Solibacter sp.]
MASTISNLEEAAANHAAKIWLGIAVGAAVGIGIALSRRKRGRWETAKEIGHRISDRSGDLADATRGLVERVRNIYEETRKVVDDAGTIWHQGRKLVRH